VNSLIQNLALDRNRLHIRHVRREWFEVPACTYDWALRRQFNDPTRHSIALGRPRKNRDEHNRRDSHGGQMGVAATSLVAGLNAMPSAALSTFKQLDLTRDVHSGGGR
jgi:hypothetical protein